MNSRGKESDVSLAGLLRATSGGKWSGVTWRSVLLALAIATIHGLSVEWEQMYIPTRMAEWRDVRNDVIGAALALAPGWAWATMKRRP